MNRLYWTLGLMLLGISAQADGERLLESTFQQELASLRQELGFPGATAAFVMPDGYSRTVAVGIADVETSEPMHPHSRMLAASIGKTFVSATALALVSGGRLNLDDPISNWIGEAAWFSRLPHGQSITVRHLLTHRSGLPDHVHTTRFQEALKKNWREAETFTPEALIGFILDEPTHTAPGETWIYSDTGYIILGLILEQACGQSLYREVNSRFLKPLGLIHTIPSNQRQLPGLVPGYTSPQNAFGFPAKTADNNGHMQWHPGVEGFGGGWLTTAGDLAQWAHAIYAGSALPETVRAELFRTIPISNAAETPRYGLGVSHHTDGPLGPTLGHGGWIPGYVSSVRHYARYGITVAFQINTDTVKAEENWLNHMETRLAQTLIRNTAKEEIAKHE